MIDFEKLSDAANFAGFFQRREARDQTAETNQLLREQNELLEAERKQAERKQSLPMCWHCGGRLELRGASICPHCKNKLDWSRVGGQCLTPSEFEKFQNRKQNEKERERRRKEEERKYRQFVTTFGKNRIALAKAVKNCRVICFAGLCGFCALAGFGFAGTALVCLAMQYLLDSAPQWWLTTSTWKILLACVTLGAVAVLSHDQMEKLLSLCRMKKKDGVGVADKKFVQTHLIILWLDLIVSVAQIICWLLAALLVFLLVFRWCAHTLAAFAKFQATGPFDAYPTLGFYSSLGFYSLLVAPGLVNLILITPLYSLRRKSDGTVKPTTKEGAKTQPVAYYLKRGETIRGPLERVAILQAATGKKLLSGDRIANTKAGPWQDITKEQLQEMQQGSDVEIKDSKEISCPKCGFAYGWNGKKCDHCKYRRKSD